MKSNKVIGFPLTHTQSPLLHQFVYQNLNLNAEFKVCSHQNLDSLIQEIKNDATELVAVTMPFKEKILNYVDFFSEEVKQLKSANTLIQKNGKFYAYNTDINGIEFALSAISLSKKNILIIGAGGAAKAAGYVFQKNNSHLYWLNRTKETASVCAKNFCGEIVCETNLHSIHFDMIVNTTPLGMYPDIFSSPLPADFFKSHHIVFDFVYRPLKTKFLSDAEKGGAKIISGVEMFIGQGLKQIELWINQHVQIDIISLRKKILAAQ